MKRVRQPLLRLLSLPLAALLLGSLHVGCGDDEPATVGGQADSGAMTPDATTKESSTADDSGSSRDGAVATDAAADAPSGPTISEDPNAPTSLALGATVTANLGADKEHFFAFTTGAAGTYTLNFTSPTPTSYASFAAVKGAHSCGLPSCVQGSGTAPLANLAAATTYYLNLYNGAAGPVSYTLSVTAP